MSITYTLDVFAPDNLTKPTTQATTEQVAICDKTEALGWDYIDRDSDRTTNVTITQKKHGFIATAAVGDFTDSDNYQFIIPEDMAELTAAGDMTPSSVTTLAGDARTIPHPPMGSTSIRRHRARGRSASSLSFCVRRCSRSGAAAHPGVMLSLFTPLGSLPGSGCTWGGVQRSLTPNTLCNNFIT